MAPSRHLHRQQQLQDSTRRFKWCDADDLISWGGVRGIFQGFDDMTMRSRFCWGGGSVDDFSPKMLKKTIFHW